MTRDGVDWARVARDYARGTMTVDQLCARHGLTRWTLYRRATIEGWPRRQPRGGRGRKRALGGLGQSRRETLIGRLLTILEQEVDMIEETMGRGGEGEEAATVADGERRLRSINALLRTLDSLKQPGQGRQEAEHSSDTDTERLRRELARRLARLRPGGDA